MKSLRRKIDLLDKRIVRLLNKRAKYADEIGKIKEKLGLEVYSPEREKQVIENVSNENPGPLTDDAIGRVYERIIDESRRLERESAEERRISLINNQLPVRSKILSAARWFKRFIAPNRLKKMSIVPFHGQGRFDLKSARNLALLVSSAVAAFVLVWCIVLFLPYHYAHGRGTIITIDRGMNADKVYAELLRSDVITNKFMFKVMSRIFSSEHKIKAGKYLFAGNFSEYDVMRIIASGKSNLLVTVTIPEGFTVRRIASIYHRELGIDSTEFADLAFEDSSSEALGIPSRNLEGYLFPQTYDFYYDTDPREILERMVDEFDNFFNDSLRERAAQMGLSISEVMKMASIIEDEARVDSERPIIASVYYNRLKKRMPLESDPTVQYAIGERTRVYYKELKIDSPFNTYERIGLPPTPICNPGAKSIIAALYPAKTNYLYFVANGHGGHRFSDTYDEHLRAVRAYKRNRMR
jgi:UPF0755 protein